LSYEKHTNCSYSVAGFTFAACEDLFDKEKNSPESADEGSTSDPIVIPAIQTPVATDFDIGNLTQAAGRVTPELVLVRNNLISSKTITLTGDDLKR
jgi:hypothetical protein